MAPLRLPELFHVGWVVRDCAAAQEELSARLGAGPFLSAGEEARFDAALVHGKPAPFALRIAFGALGGVVLALISPLSPELGVWTLVRGFAAMTLGGFGSLGGAVVGGLLLGIMEKLLGFYASTVFIDITAYLVTILVLLIRPRGLFGQHATVRI